MVWNKVANDGWQVRNVNGYDFIRDLEKNGCFLDGGQNGVGEGWKRVGMC